MKGAEAQMKFLRLTALLAAAALALPACNRGGGGAADPTLPPVETAAAVVTSAASTVAPAAAAGGFDPQTAASTPSSTSAAAAPPGPALPPYEVRHRMIEDSGETLVVLVEPGSYSNVELENLVYDIVEQHSPRGAVVVDDSAAADLAVLDERTAEQQDSLDSRTLLRIDNGVEVTFHGPYADFPGLTVGS